MKGVASETRKTFPVIKLLPYVVVIVLLFVSALYPGTITTDVVGMRLSQGLMQWFCAEYLLHRFVLHKEWRRVDPAINAFKRHKVHHDDLDPEEYQLLPMKSALLILAAVFLLRMLIGISGGWDFFAHYWQGAYLLTAGNLVGYISYEFVHFNAHVANFSFPLLRYLRKYHLQHHGLPERHFGVTNPFIDWVAYFIERFAVYVLRPQTG